MNAHAHHSHAHHGHGGSPFKVSAQATLHCLTGCVIVDYHMGGMAAPSVFSWMFLRGFLVAVPAGFLAAWPVNYWLIKRDLKRCH